MFSEQDCYELKPQNGRHAVLRFLNALVKPQKAVDKQFSLPQVLARLNQHARPGSLVYIVSDFRGLNDESETYIAKLAKHCEVVLIFIYDPLESSLPVKGRFRFTDERSDVVVDAGYQKGVLEYHQRFIERQQRLESLAKKRGLAFIQCSTQSDPVHCLR